MAPRAPHSQLPEEGSPIEHEKARDPVGTVIHPPSLQKEGSPTEQEKVRGPVGTVIPPSQPPELRGGESACLMHVGALWVCW